MKQPTQTPYENALNQAKRAAERDLGSNLVCNPTRHGAAERSAWADWYRAAYQEVAKQVETLKQLNTNGQKTD